METNLLQRSNAFSLPKVSAKSLSIPASALKIGCNEKKLKVLVLETRRKYLRDHDHDHDHDRDRFLIASSVLRLMESEYLLRYLIRILRFGSPMIELFPKQFAEHQA